MGKDNSVVIGHRYYWSILMGFFRGPADYFLRIEAGGKTAWAGTVTSSQITSPVTVTDRGITRQGVTGGIQINQPDLFGGETKEGGIEGHMDLMMGEPDQGVNYRYSAMVGGAPRPAYRGLVTGFFDGMICAMSPYPKPWSIRGARRLKGWDGEPWYPEKCAIDLQDSAGNPIYAMNPAHMLYEAFTNRDWGRKLPRSMLDDASWRAAADKLHAEGFGLCLKYARSSSLADYVGGILDHIGGAYGIDRKTGLLVIMLVRDDYVVADLPLFTPDTGLLGFEEDSTGAMTQVTNEVIVQYTDPVKHDDSVVARVQNLASIRQIGRATETVEYPGVPTFALAKRLAARDLRIKSGFSKRFTVRLDRRGRVLSPGAAFRVSDPSKGIVSLILRAGRVEDGTLTSGEIRVIAVSDVFGLPNNVYASEQSGGGSANTQPTAIAHRRLAEATYRDLARRLSAADLATVSASACYLQALAARPTSLSLGYQITTRPGSAGDFTYHTDGSFVPAAILGAAIGPTPTAALLLSGIDLDQVSAGACVLIDDEIARVDTLNTITGSITLGRGCADTVPAAHAAGARVWIYDTYSSDQVEYAQGVTAQAKLLTRTSAGVLDASLATADSLAFASRQYRPYPPARLRINGSAYPAEANRAITITWAHRNRLTQADQMIDESVASITPEAGTTYSLRVLRTDTNAVLHSQTGLTGTAHTVPALSYDGQIRIEVWSLRDGLESLQRAKHTLDYLRTEAITTETDEPMTTESGEQLITET